MKNPNQKIRRNLNLIGFISDDLFLQTTASQFLKLPVHLMRYKESKDFDFIRARSWF